MKPKGPLDASTYTKWLRQKANIGMYNNDISSSIPQYERKSIVSRAPAADLPALGFFTQLQLNAVVTQTPEIEVELDVSGYSGESTFTSTEVPTSTKALSILLTTSEELRNSHVVIMFTDQPVSSALFGSTILTVTELGVDIPAGTFVDEVNTLKLVFVNTISAGTALEASIAQGYEQVQMDISPLAYPGNLQFTATAPLVASTFIVLTLTTSELFRTNAFTIATNGAGVVAAVVDPLGTPISLTCSAGNITVPANTFTTSLSTVYLVCSTAVSSSNLLVFTIAPVFEALSVNASSWAYPASYADILSLTPPVSADTSFVSVAITTSTEIRDSNIVFNTSPIPATGAKVNGTTLVVNGTGVRVPGGTFGPSSTVNLQLADQVIGGDTLSFTILPDFQVFSLDASAWVEFFDAFIVNGMSISPTTTYLQLDITRPSGLSSGTVTLSSDDGSSNPINIANARTDSNDVLTVSTNTIVVPVSTLNTLSYIRVELASTYTGPYRVAFSYTA